MTPDMTEEPIQRESDDAKVARLRELLPATSAGIYLDAATFGPLPAETAAAMREADDWELRVGRATVGRDEDVEQRVEEARAVLAALLVGDPSEVVLTAGADHALVLAERISSPDELVILPHVDPETGTLLTRDAIAAASGDGVLVAVDATLSAATVPFAAADLGADFVALAGDRWLLGPEQTAALWIGRRAADRAHVPASSGLGRTALLGLARSVGWIEMYVGLEWAYARNRMLAKQLHESLWTIPKVSVSTPPEGLASIVSLRVEGWPIGDAIDELRRRVFAIVGLTPSGEQVRASVGWWNTAEEIETFCGAVADIAANTPDSIPRRLPLLGQ